MGKARWQGETIRGRDRGQKRMRQRSRWQTGMRWGLIVAAIVWASAGPAGWLARAQDSNVDRAASEALTAYLKQNRLPLVGAQVMKDSAGGRHVVLYGFVASDTGKVDAEKQAASYLGAPAPSVDDRIVVKPELANMTGPPQADQSGQPDAGQPDGSQQAAPTGQQGASGNLSFDSLYDQIQRYGVKSPPGE